MPIPAFTADGLLPEGIHDCTLDELRERFGQFQRTDRRPRLYGQLETLVREAQKTGFFVSIIIDGSFVTENDTPNDVDLILVLHANHDMKANLRPFEYNVVSKWQLSRLYKLDAFIDQEGEKELEKHVKFFGRVRGDADRRKGMLRIFL